MTECDSVFIWSRFDNWSHRVVEWFEEVVPEASRDAATQDPMMYFDLTKDPDANSQTDPTRRLSRKFKEAYSKIRLFHACRPSDIGSYIQKGLLPLSTIDADNGARILFRSQKTPLVSERALSDAVAELSRENRGGYLYLSLDDIGLVRDAGHYLIYGSEYHGALAATLSKRTGVDCLVVLQKIGIPTVFACNVPLGYVSESTLQSLVCALISRAILEPGFQKKTVRTIDFTFTFSAKLPASVIRTHYHPSRILDRIKGGVYVNPKASCPFCAVPSETH